MFRVLVSCLDRSSLDHGSCLDRTCSGTFNGCTRFSSRILRCNKKTNVILVWVKSELYILSSWIDFLETLLVVWVTVMHFKMTSHLCYLGCSTHLFDGCGSTSRTRRPATPQKQFMVKECDNELMVLTSKESGFPDPNPVEHPCQNKSDPKRRPHPLQKSQRIQHQRSGARHHRTPLRGEVSVPQRVRAMSDPWWGQLDMLWYIP